MLKILIISSCTKSKQPFPCEAKELYTGLGHKLTSDAVKVFIKKGINVDWKILSAGYGLIDSAGKIYAPYDITFYQKSASQIIEMSDKLGIPESIDECIEQNDVIIFSMSPNYIKSIQFTKLTKLSKDKMFIFVDTPSTSDVNYKTYLNIDKKANLFNWRVHGIPPEGNKVSYGGAQLKWIANDVLNIQDFKEKYLKDKEFCWTKK